MRFIGKTPDGKLMKGAPGNYKAGEVRMMPFRHSKYRWWQLVEPLPELVVPPVSGGDAVYEEAYHVPWEEETTSTYDPDAETTTLSLDVGKPTGLLGGEEALIESVKDYQAGLAKVEEAEVVPTEESFDAPKDAGFVYSREELMKKLDEAGVEYNRKAWINTLQAMVEKLESEKGA